MTITYDDKDQTAIDFAKWLLKSNYEKYWDGETYLWSCGTEEEFERIEYTTEELYQIYLKQKQ